MEKKLQKWKLFFSAFTVAFAILSLTEAMPTDISMPVTFVGLAITMLLTAKEYRVKGQKSSAIYFLLLGIFLLAITAYNVASIIWGI